MNKSYRLIYNEITNTWVAVAENVKGRGKRASGAVLLAAAGAVVPLLQAPVWAAPPVPAIASAPAPTQLPTGGQVVAGQASINQNAATLNINQSTNRAAIDWATFNVGSQAQVNFNQPGSSSVTLNRVLDSNPSQIFGKITAPGQVFLTNPNGMYFAPSASVDVGGLAATTHSISNADFMA
ncbi:MAG: filamentous hemagglutinin N-terminal domain-containing protein, partial [Comamonadaceae bacterium]